MNRYVFIGLVLTVAIVSVFLFVSKNQTKTMKYTAVLQTSAGEISIKLYTDKVPITVNNFVTLSRKKFYNNTIFHRVIK